MAALSLAERGEAPGACCRAACLLCNENCSPAAARTAPSHPPNGIAMLAAADSMPAPVTGLPLPACGVRGAYLDGECGSSGRARRRPTICHAPPGPRFGNGQGIRTTTGCAASCCLRPRASTCGRRAAAASGVLRRVLRRDAGSFFSPQPSPCASSHATCPPHPRPALQAPAGPNYHGGGRLNELATLPGSTAPSTLPNSTLLLLNPKPNPTLTQPYA